MNKTRALKLGLCSAGMALGLVCNGCGAGDPPSEHTMRACLQRSGVVTNRSAADTFGVRPSAFEVGRDEAALVLIFKNARIARQNFYLNLDEGTELAPGLIQAANVELQLFSFTSTETAQLHLIERCVFGAHTRAMLSPSVPGQRTLTPEDAVISRRMRQQIAKLHVFGRARATADAVGDQGLRPGYVPAWTRLAATLPNHSRIYFVVYSGVNPNAQGSELLQWWLPEKTTEDFGGLPGMASPGPTESESMRRTVIWEALVPNDVARETWRWRKTRRRPALVVKIATPDNLAVAVVPHAYVSRPSSATAYSVTGKILGES